MYDILDISLAPSGRDKIDWVRDNMPLLRSYEEEFSKTRPFEGIRLALSIHLEAKTAYLCKVLLAGGAEMFVTGSNPLSTQDDVAAALVHQGMHVFAVHGASPEEYEQDLRRVLEIGPDLIVDDGGDATLLLHLGCRAEKDPSAIAKPTCEEEKALFATIAARIKRRPGWFARAAAAVRGVSEETTTGVHRLYQLEAKGELLFPAVNVNDSVTKSKFDNIYGCRESLVDGIKRATDVMLAGKNAFVCGYGDVGKGCAESLRENHCRVRVSEVDPICALQACMAGFDVGTVEDALKWANLFVTTTGNVDIITAEHMAKMRDRTIVCNIGHFDDEIQVARLMSWPGVKRTNIKPQVDKFTFPDGHSIYLLAEGRLVNLGCATGHPGFVMSNSFTNQCLAQMKLWKERASAKPQVVRLPKELDEEVARLHLAACGAKLTKLTKRQADYIGVNVNGPFKPDYYRY